MNIWPDPAIVMVAPNGARRGKADHPALPVTVGETVDEAARCFEAGATVLHAHVRDKNGGHCLDAALYRDLIARMRDRVPDMLVQVTTEAVGRYSPQEQAACLFDVGPQMVSIALREMAPPDGLPFARDVYARCADEGIHVQHILYDRDDLNRFIALREDGIVPPHPATLLFVLGRYATDATARPEDLDAFLQVGLQPQDLWFICAFGRLENRCIAAGLSAGGHARVGFENNLLRGDGSVAAGNADLVAEAAGSAAACSRRIATPQEARTIFSLPARPHD